MDSAVMAPAQQSDRKPELCPVCRIAMVREHLDRSARPGEVYRCLTCDFTLTIAAPARPGN